MVSDTGMKGRVKGLLGTPTAGEAPPPMSVPPAEAPTDAAAQQHQALQVLTLAQRTAEDHLNRARHDADRITGEARENAAQIVRDAQSHAEGLQREAEAGMAEARAAAAQMAREAQAHAEEARRGAEEIVSGARMQADEIIKDAQGRADELQHLAEQRYEEMVGSLAARRESLQQQIEALERFDREYRARLQAFMQNQLRALWVEEPRLEPGDLVQPEPAPGSDPAPQQPDYPERYADTYQES